MGSKVNEQSIVQKANLNHPADVEAVIRSQYLLL